MSTPHEGSDVARTMQLIEAENEASKQGLSGLAAGTLQHAIITAKMERYAFWLEQLARRIGSENAAKRVIAALEVGEEPPANLENQEA